MLPRLTPSDWTWEHAAHLLNRAGFGGTPHEASNLFQLGHEGSVDQFLEAATRETPPIVSQPWATPDPERQAAYEALRGASEEKRRLLLKQMGEKERRYLIEMRQHWLTQMCQGARPLLEKMTLFWHGHFATSIQKVKDPHLMWRQNDTFRQHAFGPWEEMLVAVAKDPAMLLWLDGAQSRRGMPNENFAREVMELFALGEGHYGEEDVQAAARAFVGWTVNKNQQTFVDHPDAYNKEAFAFLQQKKVWQGESILQRLASEPRSAEYIMERLWRFFASENPHPEIITGLAKTFTQEQRRFAPVLREIFMSAAFYAPGVVKQQVKSPTQWLVSLCRSLEMTLPPPLLTTQMMKQLGQELFAPPSVKGWDDGISWMSTSQLLNRYNFAGILVMGQGNIGSAPGNNNKERAAREAKLQQRVQRALRPVNVTALVTPEERRSVDTLTEVLRQRLFLGSLKATRQQALQDYLTKCPSLNDDAVRGALQLLMATPEYQLI
jgi:uncharacterized protein (DUF1800 family)